MAMVTEKAEQKKALKKGWILGFLTGFLYSGLIFLICLAFTL